MVQEPRKGEQGRRVGGRLPEVPSGKSFAVWTRLGRKGDERRAVHKRSRAMRCAVPGADGDSGLRWDQPGPRLVRDGVPDDVRTRTGEDSGRGRRGRRWRSGRTEEGAKGNDGDYIVASGHEEMLQ